MQGILRDKLFELSNAKVNLDRFLDIIHEIEKNSNYRVPSQEFFREIDQLLDSVLNLYVDKRAIGLYQAI